MGENPENKNQPGRWANPPHQTKTSGFREIKVASERMDLVEDDKQGNGISELELGILKQLMGKKWRLLEKWKSIN